MVLLLALLSAGAHQIEYSRNPTHSTVDSAVDAARILNQERSAGLVNAVLRKFAREKAELFAKVDFVISATNPDVAFPDPEKRKKLEAIVHPAVIQGEIEWMAQVARDFAHGLSK